jgi:methyl-accepting chemotaxis protein
VNSTTIPTPSRAKPQAPTQQDESLRELLAAMQRVQAGYFGARVSGDWEGVHGKLADAFNDIVAANQRMASELERINVGVGKQGKTRQRFSLGGRGGAWESMEVSVNSLIEDLLWPIQDVTRTIAAVAKGDLSQTMSLEVEGRPLEGAFLRSATIVNTMIEQLSVFSSEVTRVAREVGTEG